MIFTIIIAVISLFGLIIIHELGHFVMARRFGVKVEEFGLGLPPRLFGKKFGETIYSLNLLPFGAFVKILGEEKEIQDPRSFSQKPIWQRALIVVAGVISFWVVAAILLSIVMGLGAPTAISDAENGNLKNPKVQIISAAAGSPAQIAGLEPGDAILNIKSDPTGKNIQLPQTTSIKINKVKEVQEFTETHKGKEIVMTIERGKEVFDISLVPRINPPSGEGAMGIALIRTAIKSYPWQEAPIRGIQATGNLTLAVIQGWGQVLGNLAQGRPTGAQLMGPVGIFSTIAKVSQLGVNYFLQFIAIIAVYLALFNILPIPAVDGGRLFFLGLEAIRKKPIPQKIEQGVTGLFFSLLLVLLIFVTIKDIAKLF